MEKIPIDINVRAKPLPIKGTKRRNNKNKKKKNRSAVTRVVQQLANVKLNRNKRRQRRSVLQTRDALNSLYNSYTRALLFPECAEDAKITMTFPLPTVSYKRTFTQTALLNATGQACWIINPCFAQDTGSSNGTFFFNNDATLNLTGTTGQGKYQVGQFNLAIPPSTFGAYRLVSASCVVQPQVALNTATGYMVQGVMTKPNDGGAQTVTASFPAGVGANGPFASSMSQPLFDQAMYVNKVSVQPNIAIRNIFVPFDPSYFQFVPINQTRNVLFGSQSDDFFFVGYIIGAPASAAITFDLTLNYEFEPSPLSFAENFASKSQHKEDANIVVERLADEDDLLCQSSLVVKEMVKEMDSQLLHSRAGGGRLNHTMPEAHDNLFDKIMEVATDFKTGIANTVNFAGSLAALF